MRSVQSMLALDKVTPAEFEAATDQEFELITGTGGIALRLVAVERKGNGHAARPEPFTVRFQGMPELRLPEASYRLQNVTLGPMEIFLVQVGADAAGSYFEAVFN
jgi:hypothetical protein